MLFNHLLTNVLIVEDNEVDHFVMNKLIKTVHNYAKIITCYNGKFAIETLIHLKETDAALLPQFIFLDLSMPVMDGWQFLDEFKRLNIDVAGRIKIYILTFSIFKKDLIRSYSYPFVTEFISKPVSLTHIRSLITS